MGLVQFYEAEALNLSGSVDLWVFVPFSAGGEGVSLSVFARPECILIKLLFGLYNSCSFYDLEKLIQFKTNKNGFLPKILIIWLLILTFIIQYTPQINGDLWSSLISGILVFTLETLTLTTNVFIVIFKVKTSFGDIFAVTPFSCKRLVRI